MLRKPFAWILVVCLTGVVAAGLCFIFPKDVSPESHGRAVPPEGGRAAATVPPAGPAEAVPAADPTSTQVAPPLAPLPVGSLPTQTAGVRSGPPSAAMPEPVPPAPVTPGAVAERTVDPSVAHFTDASIPVEKRMAEVEQLGKSGDANAVQTLMKLGDTYTYLNFKAVEALGNVKSPEVAKYLEGKTDDKDPRIISYAIQSLAKVQGAEAIPVIAATIAANRQRPDGYQDTVCGAGVKALGDIGSPKGIPALAAEFENTVGKTLQHEYGSQVVAAFKAIGDPAGVPALEAYALWLQTQKDGMGDNPMGQRYMEEKIKEVRDAIASIGGERE